MEFENFGRGIVVDTGPLLIHALGNFEKGKHLKTAVRALRLEGRDAANLCKVLDRLFVSARIVFVTSYVLAELCNLAKTRVGLKDQRLGTFIGLYSEFMLKMKELHIDKDELLMFKEAWKLCFTDASVALASKKEGVPLITIDSQLIRWCKQKGIEAKHAYYEIYLSFP